MDHLNKSKELLFEIFKYLKAVEEETIILATEANRINKQPFSFFVPNYVVEENAKKMVLSGLKDSLQSEASFYVTNLQTFNAFFKEIIEILDSKLSEPLVRTLNEIFYKRIIRYKNFKNKEDKLEATIQYFLLTDALNLCRVHGNSQSQREALGRYSDYLSIASPQTKKKYTELKKSGFEGKKLKAACYSVNSLFYSDKCSKEDLESDYKMYGKTIEGEPHNSGIYFFEDLDTWYNQWLHGNPVVISSLYSTHSKKFDHIQRTAIILIEISINLISFYENNVIPGSKNKVLLDELILNSIELTKTLKNKINQRLIDYRFD